MDERAVGGGWVGSSAVNETGQRWMSAARTSLRLGAAGWMSEMVGKSKEFLINITSSDHNFNTGTLHQWMLNAAGGSWPAVAQWKIVVHSGVQLVCHAGGNEVMWFGGGINGKVIIENHGWIWGRGGNGNDTGQAGKHAITREDKITLEIINYGIIAGGGGGGEAIPPIGQGVHGGGSGGGRPFGLGIRNGSNASLDGPGSGAPLYNFDTQVMGYGGNGGDLGSPGLGYGKQGAAGYAIAGGGPIIWTVRGDVRGPVS